MASQINIVTGQPASPPFPASGFSLWPTGSWKARPRLFSAQQVTRLAANWSAITTLRNFYSATSGVTETACLATCFQYLQSTVNHSGAPTQAQINAVAAAAASTTNFPHGFSNTFDSLYAFPAPWVLDCLYPVLTQAQINALVTWIVANQSYCLTTNGGINNGFQFHECHLRGMMSWILGQVAMDGENGAGTSQIANVRNAVQWYTGLLNETKADGTSCDYNYQWPMWCYIPIMWGNATGQINLINNSGFHNNMWNFVTRLSVPNGGQIGFTGGGGAFKYGTGDDRGGANAGGSGVQDYGPDASSVYLCAQLMQNAGSSNADSAWWMGDQLVTALGWQSNTTYGAGWRGLIAYDGGVNTRQNPSTLPDVQWFGTAHQVNIRPTWTLNAGGTNFSSTSTDVQADFYCGPLFDHQESNAGHLRIWRGTDELLEKGTAYPIVTQGGPTYWTNVESRTINMSCLQLATGSTGLDLAGSQRQRRTNVPTGADGATPIATALTFFGNPYDIFGTITGVTDKNTYVVINGTYANAWNDSRVSSINRVLIYVRPAGGNGPVFVVLDYYTLSGVTRIQQTWMGKGAPIFPSGTSFASPGTGSTSAGVGIYTQNTAQNPNAQIVTGFTRGSSKLDIQFFANTGKVTFTGGAGFEGYVDGTNTAFDSTTTNLSGNNLTRAQNFLAGQWRLSLEPPVSSTFCFSILTPVASATTVPAYQLQSDGSVVINGSSIPVTSLVPQNPPPSPGGPPPSPGGPPPSPGGPPPASTGASNAVQNAQSSPTIFAASPTAASVPASFTNPVGNANAVIGHVTFDSTGGKTLTSVTDDKSNTYTLGISAPVSADNQAHQAFYLQNITNAPQTITANLSAATGFRGMEIAEYTQMGASGTGGTGVIGSGTTRTVSTLTGAAIQSAFTASAVGDIVQLAAGTWKIGTIINAKDGVSLVGAGIGQTILISTMTADNSPIIRYDTNGQHPYSISGVEFQGQLDTWQGTNRTKDLTSNTDMGLQIEGACRGVIIHDCKFTKFVRSGLGLYGSYGTTPGFPYCVVFKNTFYDNWRSYEGYGIEVYGPGSSAFSVPLSSLAGALNGGNYVYIENNSFQLCRHGVAANMGAVYIARHNTFANDYHDAADMDQHGLGPNWAAGTRWTERYNNTITHSPTVYAGFNFRGGGGVVFNNTVDGVTYLAYIQLENKTDVGKAYPLLEQTSAPGGNNPNGIPAYFWNNKNAAGTDLDSLSHCNFPQGAQATYFVVNRDIYFTQPAAGTGVLTSYSPYQYPHPSTIFSTPVDVSSSLVQTAPGTTLPAVNSGTTTGTTTSNDLAVGMTLRSSGTADTTLVPGSNLYGQRDQLVVSGSPVMMMEDAIIANSGDTVNASFIPSSGAGKYSTILEVFKTTVTPPSNPPPTGGPGNLFVQSATSGSSGWVASPTATTVTATFAAAVTKGNFVAGHVSWASAGGSISSITDDKNNAYHLSTAAPITATGRGHQIFFLWNVQNAPTTITVTFTAAVGFRVMEMAEYSLTSTTNPAELIITATPSAPGSNPDALSTGTTTGTTSKANELAIGYFLSDNNVDTTVQSGTGYSLRQQTPATGNMILAMEDNIIETQGSTTSATLTISPGTAHYSALNQTYINSAVPPPPPSNPPPTTSPFVQYKSSGTAQWVASPNTSVQATFNSAVTTGNMVVGHVSWDYTGKTIQITSIMDDQGNQYSFPASLSSPSDTDNQGHQVFYAWDITNAPTTITVTFSTGANFTVMEIIEYGLQSGGDPFDVEGDQAQSNPGSGPNLITSGPSTTGTATANELQVVAFLCSNPADATITAGSGFNPVRGTTSTGGHVIMTMEDNVIATAGTAAVGTFTGSAGTGNYSTIAAAFQVNGSLPPPPPTNPPPTVGPPGPPIIIGPGATGAAIARFPGAS